MPQDNIVDANRPSPGRMYDYFLGGNHNFEIDRQTADKILQIMPFVSKNARFQRWALQDIAVELSEKRGFDVIVDFASGLPTMDNVHSKVKPGTTVIYSDYDPVIVEYSREILKNAPNVHMFQADARHPEELLNRPEVVNILAGRRKVAFVYWGLATFIDDESIRHMAQYTYEWSAPGSCLAFNAQSAGANLQDPVAIQGLKIYEKMGQKIYIRTLEEFREMVKPWQPDGQGFISLLEWHGFDQSEFSKDDPTDVGGPMGGGYGAYLVK